MIKKLCKQGKEKPPPDRDLDASFKLADTDSSGTVDWDEFIVLYAKVSGACTCYT